MIKYNVSFIMADNTINDVVVVASDLDDAYYTAKRELIREDAENVKFATINEVALL